MKEELEDILLKNLNVGATLNRVGIGQGMVIIEIETWTDKVNVLKAKSKLKGKK